MASTCAVAGSLLLKQRSNGTHHAPARSLSGQCIPPQGMAQEGSSKFTSPVSLSTQVHHPPEVQGPSISQQDSAVAVSTEQITIGAPVLNMPIGKQGHFRPAIPQCHGVHGNLQSLALGPSGSQHPVQEDLQTSTAQLVTPTGHDRSASCDDINLVAGPKAGKVQQIDRLYPSKFHQTQGAYVSSQPCTAATDHHTPISTHSQPPCSSPLLLVNGRTSSPGALFAKTGTVVLPGQQQNIASGVSNQRDVHSYIGAECRGTDPPVQTIGARNRHMRGGTSLGNLDAVYRLPSQLAIHHAPATGQTAGYTSDLSNKVSSSM